MSKVHKSNIPYVGSATLATLSGLEITAATYTARVEADGGEVIDAAHLTDTFTFLGAQGISPRNLIFGASFGVRKVNDRIEKLYAFNGNDLTIFDPGTVTLETWRLDETGAFPVVKTETTAPGASAGALKTQGLQYLVNPGHTSFVCAASGVNMVANDGNALVPISAYYPGSAQPRAFSIEGWNTDAGLNVIRVITPNGNYDSAGTIRQWYTANPYADYVASAAYVNFTARQVTTWGNGAAVVSASNVDSTGFTWDAGAFSPSANLVRFMMGGTVNNSIATRYNKQKVAEVWHISGGTSAQGLALSQRLDTLYS
jgi:hypothetical protein